MVIYLIQLWITMSQVNKYNNKILSDLYQEVIDHKNLFS
jgi:hypothetical protein